MAVEEAKMMGVRRAPELDAVENNGEVWVATTSIDDLLLSDADFVSADNWEEATAQLEARYPAPDPALYRIIYVGDTFRRSSRSSLPRRIIVLRGWYWKYARHAPSATALESLEALAQAFGPIYCWRRKTAGYRRDAAASVRAGCDYDKRNIVVRRDERSRDAVVVYSPKRAAIREKGPRPRRLSESKSSDVSGNITGSARHARP